MKQIVELNSGKTYNSIKEAAIAYSLKPTYLSYSMAKRFGVVSKGKYIFAKVEDIDTSDLKGEANLRLEAHDNLHQGHTIGFREVPCKTDDGRYFNSEREAAEKLGLSYSTISRSIFDGARVAGVVLSFAEDEIRVKTTKKQVKTKKASWYKVEDDFMSSVNRMIAHVDRCEKLGLRAF